MDPPPLVLRPVGRGAAPVSVAPDPDGTFGPEAVRAAAAALAFREDGTTAEIHPRLLELVYRAVVHFRVPYVRVISGYRPGRETSRHYHGRAMDLILPGVADRQLAKYLSEQGFVGVGLYPISGFVHLDVRDRSYFWVDRSGPGEPNRERPLPMRRAWAADARARRRGEVAVSSLEARLQPMETAQAAH